MPKTKPAGKKAPLPKKKHTPTSARMMKLRPHDAEPLEKAAEPQEKPEASEKEPEGKKPRQARLPKMEDPEIEDLEAAAEEYVGYRDQRQDLTRDEVRLKDKLLGLMKDYNRETYNHAGIEIKVVHTETKVRVKIKRDED
jgi:hypothetical protein